MQIINKLNQSFTQENTSLEGKLSNQSSRGRRLVANQSGIPDIKLSTIDKTINNDTGVNNS